MLFESWPLRLMWLVIGGRSLRYFSDLDDGEAAARSSDEPFYILESLVRIVAFAERRS